MFNYDNIGDKIKGLAKVTFVVEAIAAVISGFAFMASDEDLILIGLLLLGGGPFVAWVSSWLLYGFGQLIENSDIIATGRNQVVEAPAETVSENTNQNPTTISSAVNEIIADPSLDDDYYVDINCPHCKEHLSFTKGQLKSGNLSCPACDTQILF